jgi:hypothetical protein
MAVAARCANAANKTLHIFAAKVADTRNALRYCCGFASDFGNVCGFLHFHSVGCLVGFVCHRCPLSMINDQF